MKYLGTNEGKVVKAIALEYALQRDELKESTKLSDTDLNNAISHLVSDGVLEAEGPGYQSFWLDNDLFHEYKAHFGDERSKEILERRKQAQKNGVITYEMYKKMKSEGKLPTKHLVDRISEWVKFKKIAIDSPCTHLFLKGDLLDSLTRELIPYSVDEVLVVNPFVEKCSLSDLLVELSSVGKSVKIITQSPMKDYYEGRRKQAKIQYHETLKQSGVELFYNNSVHAKMFVLDKQVVSSSSMNLYSDSTAGKLWEAGIVSVDRHNVISAIDFFNHLMKHPETYLQEV